MKYSYAALALATTILADSTQTAQQINALGKQITDAVGGFDQAVKGYSGGDIGKLTSASKAIADATSSAQGSLSGASPLTLTDALGIQPLFQSLQTAIDGTMSDLLAIKDKIAASKQGCEVQKQLGDQEKNAQALASLIASKVPTEVKTVAETIGGKVGSSITETKAKFADACSAGGDSSSPSSGSHSAAGGHSASGSAPPSGASGASSSSSGSSSGTSSGGKTSTTSSAPKPAVYTGAGAHNAPAVGLVALAIAAFAL